MAPPALSLTDASVDFGRGAVFAQLDVAIEPRARACLVGRNGCGKSTLLKALAGLVELDRGRRFVQPGIKVAYLPQEVAASDESVREHVASAASERGHALPAHEIEAMISRLDLEPSRTLASLSGGEARRASLARALVGAPDVLLLDEPTNHLDLPMIESLERVIDEFPGAVLLISHDRAFLTRVSRRVLWLERGALRVLDGGFAGFEAWSEQVLEDEAKALDRMDKTIAGETQWLLRSVRARRSRNEGRKRRLLALREERANWVGARGRLKLQADIEQNRSRLIIEAEGLGKSVPAATPGGRPRAIIESFSTRILRGDRVGIVGPNGSGKTTLVRLLTGDLAPDRGRVRVAKTINPAYFEQRRAALDPSRTLWRTLCPAGGDQVMVGGEPRHVVSYLRDFLFDARQAETLVGALSGGERNRLMLALTLARPSNLLVLDEPTNDLDMDTLDMLQEVLSDYEGTLLIVSHDRDFLDRLVHSTILLSGDGRVEEFAGGYSDAIAQHRPPAPARADKPRPARMQPPVVPRARLSWKETRELETLPGELARLAAERARHEAALADPTLYGRDRAGFERASAALAANREAASRAEERWLELEMKREALARERGAP